MIIDSLDNASKYFGLHPLFPKAFAYVKDQDLKAMQPGKYEIEGSTLQVSVSEKPGYKAEEAKFEAHNNHIDIQVCLFGQERMGWKSRKDCNQVKTEYDAEKDVIFFNDTPDTYFTLKERQFAIFYPEDVHAPMIGEGNIKKLVVKVRL